MVANGHTKAFGKVLDKFISDTVTDWPKSYIEPKNENIVYQFVYIYELFLYICKK